jgi:hypothetical protein
MSFPERTDIKFGCGQKRHLDGVQLQPWYGMGNTTSPWTLPSLFTNTPEYPSTGNFEVIDIPGTIHTDATLFPCSHEVITKKIYSHRYPPRCGPWHRVSDL